VGAGAEAGGRPKAAIFWGLWRCIRDGQRIGDGLGAGVEALASSRKWGQVQRQRRPKAAIFPWVGALWWGVGTNCGAAIGMGSGPGMGDGLGAGPGVGGEKEVG
jgi:hypothetical protein